MPSSSAFNPSVHLTRADVAVDSHHNPTMLAVNIKFSKTDQMGKRTTIYLGRTSGPICPVSAMLQYVAIRPVTDGVQFITKNSNPLSKSAFATMVQVTLRRVGIDPSRFKGHSFRIGAATTAAACGLNKGLIKMLGR